MTNLVDLVGAIAKQAMNKQDNTQQSQQQNQSSGLDSILGSVLGQVLGGNNSQQTQQQSQSKSGLDSILGSVLGQVLGGNNTQSTGGQSNIKSAILMAVIPLILNWIQQQGGLQGALDKLRGSGLSSQVNNWVDPNAKNEVAPISEVQNLFSDAEINQVAQQTASSKQDVYSAISDVLPQVINSLTPQGNQTNTAEANNDIQNVMNLVSQFMKR